MKNKTPPKKESEIRGQYTVVLEDIRSTVKGVAEGLTSTNEKMDRGFKNVDNKLLTLSTKIDTGLKDVYKELKEINEKFDEHTEENKKSFDVVNNNMRLMRTEISLIRHNQITRDEFKALEDRVFTIENKLAK